MAREAVAENAVMSTTWRPGNIKLAALLYGSLVIAGKIFAAPPAVAELPHNPPLACDQAHAASSCGPRVQRKADNGGQAKWQRLQRLHIATSSSN